MTRAILVFALLAASTCAGRASIGLTKRALDCEQHKAQQAAIDAQDLAADEREGAQR